VEKDMDKQENKLRLEPLRSEVAGPVKIFAKRLKADITGELQSLTLVGSSLTDDFNAGKSDINTVLVVNKQSPNVLRKLAAMGKLMGAKRISTPILMTPEYIEQSLDVFGIEFLDFQLIHHTVLGPDPFESLSFDKNNVRLQCERELKATLIRMRQGYISSVNRKKLILEILVSVTRSLSPYLRAMLWLKGEKRPKNLEAVSAKSSQVFSIETDALTKSRRWWYSKEKSSTEDITNTFWKMYETVDLLAKIVDALEV